MAKNGKEVARKGFSAMLLKWNSKENSRQMPWKGEKDPYKIWLSEIILQQTRVEQGLQYYNRFVSTFPKISDLAGATEEKIFKFWEGLGYYSRCRNLISTARYISSERKGRFPETYEEIKALKGVGPYTAAAISSFAYNLPYAVVDGNVFRVLARIFGIEIPIDSTKGKKHFTQLANDLLDKEQPGIYNQAIMDFGAVVCKPQSPLCSDCPFRKKCYAFINDKVNELPIKEKKITIRKRWFYYLVIEHKDMVMIGQRTAKDIWQQLYEFPMIETKEEQPDKQILAAAQKTGLLGNKEYEIITISPLLKQQLSHQLIAGKFITIRLRYKAPLQGNYQWVKKNELEKYPLPKFINEFLQRKEEQALF